jgi:hypothetical protein
MEHLHLLLEEKKNISLIKEETASSWVKSKMLRIHHTQVYMVLPYLGIPLLLLKISTVDVLTRFITFSQRYVKNYPK